MLGWRKKKNIYFVEVIEKVQIDFLQRSKLKESDRKTWLTPNKSYPAPGPPAPSDQDQ